MSEKYKIKIPLSKPMLGQEELRAVERVMASGCLAGTCPETKVFEKKFADFIGAKYACATSSATTALHLACLVLGANHETKCVCPSYTFPATATSVLYCGSKLDIIDVEPDTFNMSIDCLPDDYSPDIIMPVHCFGNPADMGELKEYADSHDAKLIEDAACAYPAYYHGKHAGTIGDVGCYSFYCIKNMCLGEGGALVTDNEELAELAHSLCDFGKTTSKPLPKFDKLGYNYRLSSLQAAVGVEQLKKLPWMHSRRLEIAKRYDKFISSELTEYAYSQVVMDRCTSAYQRYAVVLNPKINRDKVMEEMEKRGIQTAIGTYCLSSEPYFKKYSRETPISKILFEQSLSLPMYPELTNEEVETVCDELRVCLCSN